MAENHERHATELWNIVRPCLSNKGILRGTFIFFAFLPVKNKKRPFLVLNGIFEAVFGILEP